MNDHELEAGYRAYAESMTAEDRAFYLVAAGRLVVAAAASHIAIIENPRTGDDGTRYFEVSIIDKATKAHVGVTQVTDHIDAAWMAADYIETETGTPVDPERIHVVYDSSAMLAVLDGP